MKGFSNRWKDFPDYILGITHEIWESRGIGTLTHYYSDDIIVRSPSSVVTGNTGVISATMSTLAEFPDRQLLGEDVIWSGTPEDGMLSSHRILSTATHATDGVYGKATGKKLVYRIIADCHAINDQINDEWLIRDQGAIVRQLGWDPMEFARQQIADEGGPEKASRPFHPAIDIPGPYKGAGNDNEWGARYAGLIQRIMDADMAAIPSDFERGAHLEYPGGVTAHGHEGADAFWMGLRASFPSARLTIHHVIGREDPMMPPRAAVRFSLDGAHDGWGTYGRPTGAPVHIMAIAHAEFGCLTGEAPKLRREWVTLDETAIWKQILMATGAA